MALQCGIVGLSKVGKTTLFNCLSSKRAEAGLGTMAHKSNIGMFNVPDQRLYELEKYQPTKKVTPATVDIVDIPGITKGGGKEGNKFVADIRRTDAIIHVLRCFDDENVPHVDETIDPVRDKENIDIELIGQDLFMVESKLLRMEKKAKSGDKDAKQAVEALIKYKDHFENLLPARAMDVKEDQKQHVKELDLVTDKPVLYVCNVDEDSAVKGNAYVEKVKESIRDEDAELMVIAAALEADIAELEDEEDRTEFLKDSGLGEPGVNRLIRAAYKLLDLKTFFTIGPDEIRAWTIKNGMTAPEAAGVIHSDLQRGFIRAEVIKYDDFVALKSEQACKDKGKMQVEGKKYIVEDGDILHVRFNV
ncbi:MAG: redox-regulated ATPase YchF [Bacteroidales bacterium]